MRMNCGKKECHDCANVIYTEEDPTGRERTLCELDECKFSPCSHDNTSDEPDVFKPCPICGMQLRPRNIAFADEDGERMGEMGHIIDYEDIESPVNAMYPEERVAAEQEGDTRRITECEAIYRYACDHVEFLILRCTCGFQFCMCADDLDFPDKGWLNKFASLANRRLAE